MAVSFSVSPLWILPAAFLVGLFAWWLYRRTTPQLPPGLRLLLGSLRASMLLVLILLLMGPVWHQQTTVTTPPVVALLLDTSQSMGLKQEQGRNLETIHRALFSQLLSLFSNSTVRTFSFDRGVTPLPPSLDSLPFDGPRTNIASALETIRERLKNEPLRAVVLVSDGRYNTGKNPLHVAEKYPVPIFTVIAGDTSEHRDVRIYQVSTNELVYVGTRVPIQVHLLQQGYDGKTVHLRLRTAQGRTLQDTTVVLRPSGQETSANLYIEPERPGLHSLELSVSHLPEEITYENNRTTLTFQVLERKKRLLLLAGAPDPTLASIRQILSQDRDLELTVRTQKDASSFYEGNWPDSLTAFDALLLVGYPGSRTSAEDVQRIRTAAEAGTPLAFFMTYTVPPQRLQLLLPVLPITFQRNRHTFAEIFVAPTEWGRSHTLLRIPEISSSVWEQLPPLHYNESGFHARPGARTLLQIRMRATILPDPVLAIWKEGTHRSLAFLGAGSWKWHNPPSDLKDARTIWEHLVENSVRWLTARDVRKPVRVVPISHSFDEQETIRLVGQVYDESLQPVSDATIRVEIEDQEGHAFSYVMQPLGNGQYELTTGPLPAGTYAYQAEATRQTLSLGKDSGTFSVGRLSLEFRQTQTDTLLLHQIALASGGKRFYPGEIDHLPEALKALPQFHPEIRTAETNIRLWESPYVLLLLIFLLTLEWLLRKRNGLI